MKSQSKLESRIAELEATIAALTAAHAKALEDAKKWREVAAKYLDASYRLDPPQDSRLWAAVQAHESLALSSVQASLAATPATTGKDGAT